MLYSPYPNCRRNVRSMAAARYSGLPCQLSGYQVILTCVSSQSHSSRFAKRPVLWKSGHTTGARGKPPFLLHAKVRTIYGKLQKGRGVLFSLVRNRIFVLLFVQTHVLARVVVVEHGDGGRRLRIVADRPDVEVVRVSLRTRRQPRFMKYYGTELLKHMSLTRRDVCCNSEFSVLLQTIDSCVAWNAYAWHDGGNSQVFYDRLALA